MVYHAPMAGSDMQGRVCVVTGANTGIGRVTAMELAGRGAEVVLACRSEDKTIPVIEEIQRAGGRARFLELDLTSLGAARTAADRFLSMGLPLHVLIDNAGLAGKRGVTADGFELTFGVNHMGHFAFTVPLLDKLRASAPARVVVVSSKGHYDARGIEFDALRRKTRSITGLAEYSVSKLANVLFAAELGRRLQGTGVTTYSLHPGVIASDVWRQVPWPVRPLIKRFMITVEEGARTSLHCATAPELAGETGQYYDDCKPKKPSKPARDEALARELWAYSERWMS